MTGPRVLYIDDDPGLARLVARTMERAGYQLVHAENGETGLERLRLETFDVVALDHHMPGRVGLEVLKDIRALPAPPPVIYVTGSEASQVAVAALKAGAVDYVWKDVQGHFRELLVEAVSAAVEQEALRRAKEAADQEVREARDRAEILLKEVNHRVANSLALVAGFARLTSGAIADPRARDALEDLQARIHAIAGVHRRLYTSHDVGSVELDAYLASLVEELEAVVRATGRDHPIRLEAAPVVVATDRAVSIGVVLTELVTNAYKYAYPEGASGEIRVRLTVEGETAALAVEDDGVGWDGKGPAQGTGLGARVIKAMAANLGSAVVYAPRDRGTAATVAFAVSR